MSQWLSPQKVLENILIARAFTWDQMIELLENKLSKLEYVKVVYINLYIYFDYLKDIRNKLQHPDARFSQFEAEDVFPYP